MKSSRLVTGFAFLAASFVASVATPAELRYSIRPIVSNDPALDVQVGDLNNLGEVVGWTSPRNGLLRAFRWRDGTLTDLHDVIAPGASSTLAINVNDRGTIVGLVNFNQGFRLRGTQVTPITVVPGETSVQPSLINDRDQLVVFSSGGAQSGDFFVDGQNAELLPGLPGGIGGDLPLEMNDRGVVVGSAFTADFMRHATLWQSGTLTDLGAPAGAQQSIGRDINNLNRVAGAVSGESFVDSAATWQNGTWTLLPALAPDVAGSDASNINDLGVVVGSSFLTSSARSVATVWFNGQAFALDDLVSTSDPLKPFVRFDAAVFVNIRGDIVASGSDSRGPPGTRWYFLRLLRQ
jgi:probable HAF family extracellular repeat protein